MPLTGPQIGRIHKAILAAYDYGELRQVVRIGMDERLETLVSSEKPFRAQVFELIEWADRNGRVVKLLSCICDDRPDDAGLAALHAEAQSWGAPIPATLTASPPPPAGPHPIFLSYSHKDGALKDRLLADLHAAGLAAWTDDGLEPGTPEWQRAIEQAIRDCRCLVAILSPDAKQSKWVNIEISYADDLERPIFPVLARGDRRDALPFALYNAQYVDLRADFAGQVQGKLLPALRRHLGATAAPEAPPPVQAEVQPPPQEAQPPIASPPPVAKDTATKIKEPAQVKAQPTLAAPLAEVRALVERMQDVTLPAAERLEAGLRAADLGDLPPDLDAFIPVPGQPFRMGKYPVTNAQFRRFMDAGGYKPENEKRWWSKQGINFKHQFRWTEPHWWNDRRFNRPTQPVVGVSWHEAEAYCAWLNEVRAGLREGERARLPTQAEWEAAARNGRPKPADDAQDYPWRGPFRPALANTKESNLQQTTPVHMYPAGATQEGEGICDLAGNVWEWTQDPYGGRTDVYWLKGGSWSWAADRARASAASWINLARHWFGYSGVRVVVVPFSRSF